MQNVSRLPAPLREHVRQATPLDQINCLVTLCNVTKCHKAMRTRRSLISDLFGSLQTSNCLPLLPFTAILCRVPNGKLLSLCMVGLFWSFISPLLLAHPVEDCCIESSIVAWLLVLSRGPTPQRRFQLLHS